MKILWMTWKDRSNPRAGGAELVNEEIAKRLTRDGHEVIFLVASFTGNTLSEECRDGFKIIRLGNSYTVYWKAYQYYKKNLQGWADRVIDEVNTIPFFAPWYVKEPVVLFVHQLCREIWFYQMRFPLNFIGYLAEPIYLYLLRRQRVITVSESTKKDLLHSGFLSENIEIIPEAIETEPVKALQDSKSAVEQIVLSLGSFRSMKRTHHQIEAFEIAKQSLPELRMKIAGDGSDSYGKRIRKMIQKSRYSKDIEHYGRVGDIQKIELLQASSLLLVTSVKEGWGLVVTEANSQGTPAIVYDVDGLRDSVRHNETGIITQKNSPESLAESIVLLLSDPNRHARIRHNAWEWSKTFNFEKTCRSFLIILR